MGNILNSRYGPTWSQYHVDDGIQGCKLSVNEPLDEENGADDEAFVSSEYEDEVVSSPSEPDEGDGVGDQAGSSEEETDNSSSELGFDKEVANDKEPPLVKDLRPFKKG
ncbi:hypothetical protein DM860_009259 [Cuscuta australis]|uniref:Uncharacterized protein n=1 Tax=Cuscuta australis TaxID=267555 RepID=A0A328DA71_9ASTE|nr:hypothetical protein DM860_009259 [Cuscuta australis]